jgi:hypothetical protein
MLCPRVTESMALKNCRENRQVVNLQLGNNKCKHTFARKLGPSTRNPKDHKINPDLSNVKLSTPDECRRNILQGLSYISPTFSSVACEKTVVFFHAASLCTVTRLHADEYKSDHANWVCRKLSASRAQCKRHFSRWVPKCSSALVQL